MVLFLETSDETPGRKRLQSERNLQIHRFLEQKTSKIACIYAGSCEYAGTCDFVSAPLLVVPHIVNHVEYRNHHL